MIYGIGIDVVEPHRVARLIEKYGERFARRDLLQGKAITAGVLEGTGAGVSDRGELLIDTPQGRQTVSGGEVSVRLGGASAGQG